MAEDTNNRLYSDFCRICASARVRVNFVFAVLCISVLLCDTVRSFPSEPYSQLQNVWRRDTERSRRLVPRDPHRLEGRHIVNNNFKPEFINCSSYESTILEEQPPGTFVTRVVAVDNDTLTGQTITYSIVSAKAGDKTFDIDPGTGIVTTAKGFDRDEPNREKQEWITVRAADNGRPQLDGVCNFRVSIADINDNQPIFDKSEYKDLVPLDQQPGRVVMRISATDVDEGDNGTVTYSLGADPYKPDDIKYFEINPTSGEIKLTKNLLLDRRSGQEFALIGIAHDKGIPQSRASRVNVRIRITDSKKKAPIFLNGSESSFEIHERFSEVKANLHTIVAESQADQDNKVYYELVTGTSEQTNKENTFVQQQEGNTAYIRLGGGNLLDYEQLTSYTLTLRVTNSYNLAAEHIIHVRVIDDNDNLPTFTETVTATLLENEPAGTFVVRVHAIDKDATYPNNAVKYQLLDDDKEYFSINPDTGEVTAKKMFDRETEEPTYHLKVVATDGAPSAYTDDGEPNSRQFLLKIEIADKNDNPPKFKQSSYAAEVPENPDNNTKVLEVVAEDPDTASPVEYYIQEGNTDNAFWIESTQTAGIIRAYSTVDYERKKNYNLTVVATDGISEDRTYVFIAIQNENDNPPEFNYLVNTTRIPEERPAPGCIFAVSAYDPDIEDRNAPQNITFSADRKGFSVDNSGCVRLTQGLDRDPPYGSDTVQLLVYAFDNWGMPKTLQNTKELYVELTDINDNAPYLDMPHGVVWPENREPGEIQQLMAKDSDSEADGNGPPFRFRIADTAGLNESNFFSVTDTGLLSANVKFDREDKKVYFIPIQITDSGDPVQTGTSTLRVIIGDENDNTMFDGNSSILVYAYKGITAESVIGRVYVQDQDDWDLPDKTFSWSGRNEGSVHFDLDTDTGNITVRSGAPVGTYTLNFEVYDRRWNKRVNARVDVTVKEIPEEAVVQSGSIRFSHTTPEEFIAPDVSGISKWDTLRKLIAKIVNASEENVDVFTVLNPLPNENILPLVDVRFSAHGSPYYARERLDGLVEESRDLLNDLGLEVVQVHIDECIAELDSCELGCYNHLEISDIPYAVYTNLSSLVGVSAIAQRKCQCGASMVDPSSTYSSTPCLPNPCENGGTCHSNTTDSYSCTCGDDYTGTNCELLKSAASISFEGNGWAWYPPPSSCAFGSMSIEFSTTASNGLILYIGPLRKDAHTPSDFLSLELADGSLRLLGNFGVDTLELKIDESRVKFSNGNSHTALIQFNNGTITLSVPSCSADMYCSASQKTTGSRVLLNVNAPMQLGGSSVNLKDVSRDMHWSYMPGSTRFYGCLSNFTARTTDHAVVYDLSNPSYSYNTRSGCTVGLAAAAASLAITDGFLVALLVCLALLLILVLALVIYRRRRLEDTKEMHDDIRENIMNYADEGYGEGDHSGYDLNLLRLSHDGKVLLSPPVTGKENEISRRDPADEHPDIDGFLRDNKSRVDHDPDGMPYDDVRHYAYEGDGNSTGSLSSLASGTDEGDLDFDYLSHFGPRFKKLADMYGEHSSDEEEEEEEEPRPSRQGGPPGSESWC